MFVAYSADVICELSYDNQMLVALVFEVGFRVDSLYSVLGRTLGLAEAPTRASLGLGCRCLNRRLGRSLALLLLLHEF